MLTRRLWSHLKPQSLLNARFCEKPKCGCEEKPFRCKIENKEPVPPPSPLYGKNVVYVGGFGGIGFPCCKYLVCEGIKNLVIVDKDKHQQLFDELYQMRTDYNLYYVRLDLSQGEEAVYDAMIKITESVANIDVLVNGCGVIDEKRATKSIQTNLLGLMQLTIAATRLISASQRGRGGIVVNVASVFGLEPIAFIAVYTATQHGIIGFTRAMADLHYFEHTRIAYMAICPSFTATAFFQGTEDTFDYAKPMSDAIKYVPQQSANKCAEQMVEIIKSPENGSIWIIEKDEVKKIEIKKHWERQI